MNTRLHSEEIKSQTKSKFKSGQTIGPDVSQTTTTKGEIMNVPKQQVKEAIKSLRNNAIESTKRNPNDHIRYATQAVTALNTLTFLNLITYEECEWEAEGMYIATKEVRDKS